MKATRCALKVPPGRGDVGAGETSGCNGDYGDLRRVSDGFPKRTKVETQLRILAG